MSSQRSNVKFMDFYRRVPLDLTETTSLGGLLSVFAGIFMVILFIVEFVGFLSHRTETMVVLDKSNDELVRFICR